MGVEVATTVAVTVRDCTGDRLQVETAVDCGAGCPFAVSVNGGATSVHLSTADVRGLADALAALVPEPEPETGGGS